MAPRIKSIQELRRELASKEKELDKLFAQRANLAGKLKAIDEKIQAMGGEPPKRSRGRARPRKLKKPTGGLRRGRKAGRQARRATGKPLVEYLRKALGKASKGMRPVDIARSVREAGYKTYSKDFYGIVAAALRDKKNFKRMKRGVYALAK